MRYICWVGRMRIMGPFLLRSALSAQGESKMSLCLHGMVKRDTFSLRKSDMLEVCFLFGPL